MFLGGRLGAAEGCSDGWEAGGGGGNCVAQCGGGTGGEGAAEEGASCFKPSFLGPEKKAEQTEFSKQRAEEGTSLFTWNIRIKYQYCTHPRANTFFEPASWIRLVPSLNRVERLYLDKCTAHRRPWKCPCWNITKTQKHQFTNHMNSCALKWNCHLILLFAWKDQLQSFTWALIQSCWSVSCPELQGKGGEMKRYFGTD